MSNRIVDGPAQSPKYENPEQGFLFRRTKGTSYQEKRERAFAQAWQSESDGRIPSLVQELCSQFSKNPGSVFDSREIEHITFRDRKIVATAIQWLGSNIGWDFLVNALRECGYEIVPIKKSKKKKSKKLLEGE